MAEIPLSTKNMQNAIAHVLSLVFSLLMISSLIPDQQQKTAETCLRGAKVLPGWPEGGT
jgi:hypothetical protein